MRNAATLICSSKSWAAKSKLVILEISGLDEEGQKVLRCICLSADLASRFGRAEFCLASHHH